MLRAPLQVITWQSASNQGGKYAGNWTTGGEAKTAPVDLPIAFSSAGCFGVVSPAGATGKTACYEVTKTQIFISTADIGRLVATFLTIGY